MTFRSKRTRTMHVLSSEVKDRHVTLEVLGDLKQLMAVRKRLYTEVETYAISYVEVYANNSVMKDEVLADRLSLVPFVTADPGDGVITLHVNKPGYVLSKELQSPLKLVYDDIALVKLERGEEINLKAHLTKGTSKMHMKWCILNNFTFKEREEGGFRVDIEHLGMVSSDLIVDMFRGVC